MLPEGLQRTLARARKAVAFTGAGISAESGIPTFRGDDGLWSKLRPEELANFDAFLRNPQLVSEWYAHRRHVTRESRPNPAHDALVEMEDLFDKFIIVTQNIDNLHRRAGSKNIAELHGNIERNYCLGCGARYDGEEFEDNPTFTCPKCGGLIRPDIVWFGEMLPTEEWEKAEAAAEEADVMFVVGTSAVVYPAAELPMTVNRQGGKVVEINIEETPLTRIADYSLRGQASVFLVEIVEKLKELRKVGKYTE